MTRTTTPSGTCSWSSHVSFLLWCSTRGSHSSRYVTLVIEEKKRKNTTNWPPPFPPLQILWTFSIYLEAISILPQLVLLQRTKNVDNLTGNYVFLLGLYRAFYILNWVYRYITEPHYSQWIGKQQQQQQYIVHSRFPLFLLGHASSSPCFDPSSLLSPLFYTTFHVNWQDLLLPPCS